jgi:hypothetical protein
MKKVDINVKFDSFQDIEKMWDLAASMPNKYRFVSYLSKKICPKDKKNDGAARCLIRK